MKGYWIVIGTPISDAQAQAKYVELWGPVAAKYQARMLPEHCRPQLLEVRDAPRVIVTEFPSLALAKACYEDPEYQLAASFGRLASNRELLMLEGDFSL